MVFPRTIRKVLVVAGLVMFLNLSAAFRSTESWASTIVSQPAYLAQPQLVAVNRIDAAAKGIEGKVQETIGNLADDPQNKIMGKIKQAEGNAQTKIEEAKDNLKLTGKEKAAANKADKKIQKAKKTVAAKATKDLENIRNKVNAVIK
jgi:uncharacterized protein YjbJ (UPF0337 family)